MKLAKPEYVEGCICENVLDSVYSHVRDTSRTMFQLMEAKGDVALLLLKLGLP